MLDVINYVTERDEEEGNEPTINVKTIFNRMWYYIGKDLVFDEWDHLMLCWRDQHPEEEEEKQENN
jgi:hypothetical protein